MGRLTICVATIDDWVSARRSDSTKLLLNQFCCMVPKHGQKPEAFHMSCISMPHGWETPVWFHHQRRSCRSNASRESRHTNTQTTTGGVRTCSDMFVGSQILFQLTPRFICPLTLALGADVFARRVANGLQWKQPRGRPRNTWVRQVEFDSGMTADNAWNAAAERDEWRVLRLAAGRAAVQ